METIEFKLNFDSNEHKEAFKNMVENTDVLSKIIDNLNPPKIVPNKDYWKKYGKSPVPENYYR